MRRAPRKTITRRRKLRVSPASGKPSNTIAILGMILSAFTAIMTVWLAFTNQEQNRSIADLSRLSSKTTGYVSLVYSDLASGDPDRQTWAMEFTSHMDPEVGLPLLRAVMNSSLASKEIAQKARTIGRQVVHFGTLSNFEIHIHGINPTFDLEQRVQTTTTSAGSFQTLFWTPMNPRDDLTSHRGLFRIYQSIVIDDFRGNIRFTNAIGNRKLDHAWAILYDDPSEKKEAQRLLNLLNGYNLDLRFELLPSNRDSFGIISIIEPRNDPYVAKLGWR